MESKHWWASKTIWVNLLALVAIILNSLYGIELEAEAQAAIATGVLAVLNIVLRAITKEPVGK